MKPEPSTIPEPAAIPHRRPRRRLLWLLAILSVPPSIAALALAVFMATAASRERAALDEADRVDPRWRLADLQADRDAVPDADNAALVVLAAHAAMGAVDPSIPANGPASKGRPAIEQLGASRANRAVDPAIVDEVAVSPGPHARALAVARTLAGMRRGRYPKPAAPTPLWSVPAHVDAALGVARLLADDALVRSSRGDIDGAILDIRAILGASSSPGDEPGMVSAIAYSGMVEGAILDVEHVLAQGAASDAALSLLDADLAAEEATPRLKRAFRGERALADDLLRRLSSGALTPAAIGFALPGWPGRALNRSPITRTWFRNGRGLALGRVNEALAIADRPEAEQTAPWRAWDAEVIGGPRSNYVTQILDAPGRMIGLAWRAADGFRVVTAKLRAARLAIALERHRLAHGRWPADPPPMGPFADPFEPAPLRLKRLADGWSIYSVGPDGTDEGGKLDPSPPIRPTDFGLRLYDPEHRRRPKAP